MATLAPPALSRDEWRAVAIALKDASDCGCASGERRGLLSRFYTVLTGNQPKRPLADRRLEAIRRFVCAMRRKPQVAAELVPELEAQGFSHAQVQAIALLSR